jgi:hypothetical protein
MARKEHDRFADLAADIGSPRVLPAIDKALGENQRERVELLELRKMAVRRHGEIAPASAIPAVPAPQAVEASPEPQIYQKNEREGFDGRVRSLAKCYCADRSFLELRYKTRKHYETLIKFINEGSGDKKVADWKLQDIERLYQGWVQNRTESMARSLIVMLRTLIYFGATILHDSACERLSVVLHRMRFPVLKSRSERLTADHAIAIRREARKMNRASIALAQAFQFDCKLRQKDVIGEWVPTDEPGESDVLDAGNKWLRGLRWEEIDENLVLTHTTSKSQTEIVVDLNLTPMVIQELMLAFGSVARNKMHASGPIIVSEASGLPWYGVEFRRNWRNAADKAGVPRRVKNMDTRAGAISEATNAKPSDNTEADEVDLSLELGQPNTLPH